MIQFKQITEGLRQDLTSKIVLFANPRLLHLRCRQKLCLENLPLQHLLSETY